LRIPPSLRGSVDVFVASRSYSHIGLGVGHVGILLALTLHFLFCENPLCMEFGLGIVVGGVSHPHSHVGDSHPLRGINNSNLMMSLEGVLNLTH
jgi:hypothetical protein